MKKADPYQMYLAGLLTENQWLSEMRVTESGLSALIVEFSGLSDEIDALEMQLKEKKNRYKEVEDQIRPVLEELRETKDKTLQVENIVVTIKRAGYERESVPYKEIYEHLFERVNGSMKKIVTEIREGLTKMVRVPSSIGVQKFEHGMMSGFLSFLSRVFSRMLGFIGVENEKIGMALEDFRANMEGAR